MKAAGLIAEYNPFHNGHKYQLEKIRELTGCDYIIAAMSGDFVQRGEPAFIDKYTRTAMALSQGVDLVLELPCRYAVSSAEVFARGGVDLLSLTGIVNCLCFGMEDTDSTVSKPVLECLTNDSPRLSDRIRKFLKTGLSYPAAREKALGEELSISYQELHRFLSSPNNILALEYQKALTGKPIKALPILRKGTGYHDNFACGNIASASHIRNLYTSGKDIGQIKEYMPSPVWDLIKEYDKDHVFYNSEVFSALVFQKLLSEKETGYTGYQDCSAELSAKIQKNLYSYRDFYSFADSLKSKNLTHTRISRCLLHILLNIKKEDYSAPSYLRLLGFRQDSAPLLKEIKEKAPVPLITKVADADYSLLTQDIYASDIYRSIYAKNPASYNEFTRGLIIM